MSPINMLSVERLALKALKSLFFQPSQSFFSVAMIARWLWARDIAGFGAGDGDGVGVWAYANDVKKKVRTMTRGSRLVMVVLLCRGCCSRSKKTTASYCFAALVRRSARRSSDKAGF